MATSTNHPHISRVKRSLAVLIAAGSIALGGPTTLTVDEAQAAGVITHNYANIHTTRPSV